ncbi:thermonuclease family protein [Patescibacteria group bacterium]|nr:thermonuclease family protein [Patescibacteria group bacterium]
MKKSWKLLSLYALFLFLITFFPDFKKEVGDVEEFEEYLESSFDFVLNDEEFEGVKYKVLSVTDGDTFRIDYEGKSTSVRMIGIDTPEVNHPSKPVQCFGEEASQRTKDLLLDKEVVLEQDVSKTDRYGRILAYVWLNGEMINEKLVKEGFAFSTPYPPDVKYQDILDKAEEYARNNSLGLWDEYTCGGDVYFGTNDSFDN